MKILNSASSKSPQPYVDNLVSHSPLFKEVKIKNKTQSSREKEVIQRRAGRIPEAGLGSASLSCPITQKEGPQELFRALEGIFS